MNQSILSFNNGEVTPYLRHRIDFEKTASSAEELRNFLVMPYGGVIKRPGLVEVEETEEVAALNSRLLPFIASDGSRYLLHFTPDVLTIYSTAGVVKDTLDFMDGYVWPNTHSWENSIRDLHMEQVNDVAFITHPGTFPLRLSRVTDTNWTLEFLPFKRPPLNDENFDETKTFTVASNPVAPTWASGASYAVDAKVFTNSEWLCISGHTASAANKPGEGASWRTFWRQMFYNAGDPVTILTDDREEVAWTLGVWAYSEKGKIYRIPNWLESPFDTHVIALQDHTADEDTLTINEAGYSVVTPKQFQTDNWRSFIFDETGIVPAFVVVGNWLLIQNVMYECIHAIDPADDILDYDTPAKSLWSKYWAVVPGITTIPADTSTMAFSDFALFDRLAEQSYVVNDRISHRGRVFLCISNHTAGATTEPGVGASWATYWSEVSRVVPSFSAGPFSPGQYFMLAPQRPAADFQVEVPANASGTSGQIVVQGAWNFFTYGTWYGTFQLQRSANNGLTWETQRSWEAKGDRNIADSGVEDDPVILRLVFTKATGNSATIPRGILAPDNTGVKGYALMDTYVGAEAMTGFAKTPMLSGNTFRWAYGAFNERDGYPRALCLHESRLSFAGTKAKPVSLWLSASDDLDNFETGPEADDGIAATLALSAASPIRWIASQRRLFVGTAFSEWVIGSETADAPLKGENFAARQYTGYGSLPLQPLQASDGMFFLERKGTRLRDYGFSYEREGYDGADLSRLAEHLTQAGISNMAWQQTREPGLWVVRRDGALLHFAFSRSENIRAWSKHDTTGGTFLDVAVIPSDAGDDEVFFIVKRGAVSTLERFPQHWQAAYEAGTGYVCNDPGEAAIVSRLRGLPLDTGAQDGSTQARRKRMHKIILSIFQTAGGTIWNRSEAHSQPITATAELTTGWVEIVPDAGHLDDIQLNIEHTAAHPFILRSACIRWHMREGA